MDARRKRYLIALALPEYLNNKVGKPFELQRHSDVEELRRLLETDYANLTGVLAARKAAGHRNLAGAIVIFQEDDEAPDV